MSEPYWVPLSATPYPLNNAGSWSSVASYRAGDVVLYQGSYYLAIADSTNVVPPAVTATSSGIPIDLRNPQMSFNQGNVFPTVTALTAWEEWHWEFVKDVIGAIYGLVRVPWTPTACKIVLSMLWNATAGVCRMYPQWFSVADGASLNPGALTSVTSQDITVPATARLRKDVTFTLATQPALGDLLHVQIVHDGTHANDTVAVNSELLGAWLLPA